MTTRRTFLGAASAGVAASLLGRINEIRDTGRPPSSTVDASDYSLADGVAYLNHASIGTVPKVVQKAHRDYLDLCETNPWLHMWGGAWDEAAVTTHAAAGRALGCGSTQTAVLRSTTEAFNLLAQGLPLGDRDEVLFSTLNHAGASVCFKAQARRRGYTVNQFAFPVEQAPTLDSDTLVRLHVDQITDRTRLLVLPHIDNVVGVRLPIASLVAAARAKGVRWIAVDGAQAVGMIPVDVKALGVDFYATSAHKWLQAPKGTGILYVRKAGMGSLEPMISTWGQVRWVGTARRYADYGTRDLPGMLTLAHAARFQQAADDGRERRLRALWSHLRDRVADVPHLTWRSPGTFARGASLVAVGLPERLDPTRTAQRLFEKHGVVVRPFSGKGMRHLRVAPNLATTTKDIDRLINALA